MLHERSHLSVLVLGGAPAVRERESWLEFYEAASVKGEGGGWNRAGGGADMMSTTNVEYRITLQFICKENYSMRNMQVNHFGTYL